MVKGRIRLLLLLRFSLRSPCSLAIQARLRSLVEGFPLPAGGDECSAIKQKGEVSLRQIVSASGVRFWHDSVD